MQRFVKHFRTLIVAVTLPGLAACGNGLGPHVQSRTSSPGLAETALTNGLVHRVSMSPSPDSGSDIQIRSVLVNTGTQSMLLEHRECGLDLGGTLKLSWPPGIVKCMAYSGRGQLAPGDSIVGGDYMRVASAPGRHELRVRHALDPEMWTPIDVVVR